MKTIARRPLFALAFATLGIPALFVAANDTWPNWRGPTHNGTVPDAKPPIEWSEEKNIKWKTKIPGSGLATPIVWKDRIFVLSAVGPATSESGANAQNQNRPGPGDRQANRPRPGGEGQRSDGGGQGPRGGGFNREAIIKEFDKDGDGRLNDEERAAMRASFGDRGRGDRTRGGAGAAGGGGRGRANRGGGGGGGGSGPQQEHAFEILALDRATGEVIWRQTARKETPHEGHHPTNGFASGSPVTDGKHLWVSFGSRGIYCYGLDGERIWETDLGDMRSAAGFGEGSSPALAGNLLLVLWDHKDQSSLVALDKNTGKEVWRTERDEPTSWTTPVIVKVDGKLQAIVAGANKTRSYDTATGKLVWEAAGLTSNVIPTPVLNDNHVYVVSGYKGRAVQAIKLDSKGDVTDSSNITWSAGHSAPYVASPVLSGNRLFMTKGRDAYLACFNAQTGEVFFQDEKLEGIRGIYASPIAANGHLYVLGKEGTSVVLKDSEQFEIVATNTLDNPIDASPVIVGNELFIRTHEHLYCIAEDS